jgi:hypothetical protein
MLMCLAVLYFSLHPPRTKNNIQGTTTLDPLGSLTLLTTIALPLFAINIGGNIVAWSHPVVIILLCLTPAAALTFYYVEIRVAKTPVIRLRLLRSRQLLAAFVCAFPTQYGLIQVRLRMAGSSVSLTYFLFTVNLQLATIH